MAQIHRDLVKHFGSRNLLADALNVSSRSVGHWINDDNKMSVEMAQKVEQITFGAFKANELRIDKNKKSHVAATTQDFSNTTSNQTNETQSKVNSQGDYTMQLVTAQDNELNTLNFNGHDLTIVSVNDELFFNANEVARVLEFSNPHQAIASHVEVDDLQKMEVIDSLGRKQLANFVNESGLYSLIFGSKKPSSKDFKKWVTSEVLPTLRKTGSYHTRPMDEMEMIHAISGQVIEQRKLQKQMAIELETVKTGLAKVEAIQTAMNKNTNYMTTLGFANFHKIRLPNKSIADFSRQCTKESKEQGLIVNKVPDERFGMVNSYHEDVLIKIFTEAGYLQ